MSEPPELLRGRLYDIAMSSIGVGALMGGGACTGFAAWAFTTNASGMALVAAFGVTSGVFCGLISLLYLVPMLRDTDTRRSLPYVHVRATVIGLVLGIGFPLIGAGAAFLAQYLLGQRAKYRYALRPRPECPGCGYDIEGLHSGICPECGKPFTLSPTDGRTARSHTC